MIASDTPNNQEKPYTVAFDFDHIPREIKQESSWVGWRWEQREGKWTKPPYCAFNEGYRASSTDPQTWSDYETAVACYERGGLDGIGFVLSERVGIVGIDLDKCRNRETGGVDEWAEAMVRRINSYTEISPSGTGLRILARGQLPGSRRRKGKFEIYNSGRYLTMTGSILCGQDTICERNEAINELYQEQFEEKENEMRDEDIRTRFKVAMQDRLFAALWGGRWQDNGYPSASEAVMAFLCKVVFYFGESWEMGDKIVRRSKLYSEKWERLGRSEWAKAVDLQKQRYHSDTMAPTTTVEPMTYNNAYTFSPIRLDDFDRCAYSCEWLVKGIAVAKQPAIIGGPKKSLKTSLLMDFAISLGSGLPFLGKFQVPQAVTTVFLSGESGPATLQETARRICKAKGITMASARTHLDFRLPRLTVAREISTLAVGLAKMQAEVVIIDPLYLCLLAGSQTKSASNLYDIGPILYEVAGACLDAGATPFLVHHARKGGVIPGEPLELEDLAFAGVQEFARQWLMVSRRRPYQPGSGLHSLWLGVGGSAGHSGLWAVDINEGVVGDDFKGRTWETEVLTTTEAKQDEKRAKQEKRLKRKRETDQESINELLDLLMHWPEKRLRTVNQVRVGTGWNKPKFERVFALAEDMNLIVEDSKKDVCLKAEGRKRWQGKQE